MQNLDYSGGGYGVLRNREALPRGVRAGLPEEEKQKATPVGPARRGRTPLCPA